MSHLSPLHDGLTQYEPLIAPPPPFIHPEYTLTDHLIAIGAVLLILLISWLYLSGTLASIPL